MSKKLHKFTAAFTIVELLISLAITGLLLAAVAVAFNASAINYRENENIFKAVNGARQALSRMTSQIRVGLVEPNDISNQNSCTVLCADSSQITYRYDSGVQKLYLNDSGTDYVLCENVTEMTFTKDNDTPTGDVKSVQISMTVASGNVRRTLATAAVVRKILDR